MKCRDFLLFGAFICLTACGDSATVRQAKAAIRAQMPSGETVVFRNVRQPDTSAAKSLGFVCGEVAIEAGNSTTPFRRFVYGDKSGLAQVEYAYDAPKGSDLEKNKELFDFTWDESCLGKSTPLPAAFRQ